MSPFFTLQVLGPGMNIHLTENSMVREIFGLGAPIPAINALASTKPSKQERVSADPIVGDFKSSGSPRAIGRLGCIIEQRLNPVFSTLDLAI